MLKEVAKHRVAKSGTFLEEMLHPPPHTGETEADREEPSSRQMATGSLKARTKAASMLCRPEIQR